MKPQNNSPESADSALSGGRWPLRDNKVNQVGRKRVFRVSTTIWDSMQLICLSLVLFAMVPVADAAEVTTDKPDYAPRSTAVFSGSGFQSSENVELHVTFSDGRIMPDGDEKWQVATDAEGAFTTPWTVCNCPGAALLLTVTGQTSGLVAKANFTDSPVDLEQVRNGSATDPALVVDWQHGNLGYSNAHYLEGYSVPYRLRMDIPANAIGKEVVITLGYDVKHGAHALDYLTHYDCIDDPEHSDPNVFGHPAETIDPLMGIGGITTATTDTTPVVAPTNNTPADGVYTDVPQPLGSFNANDCLKEMTIWGAVFSDTDPFTYKDENGVVSAPELILSDNSVQKVTVRFVPDSPVVVLAWGGHIASQLDWGYESNGKPRSAVGISGSPYHMRLVDGRVDNDSMPGYGSKDRSLKSNAVKPVIIIDPGVTPLDLCSDNVGEQILQIPNEVLEIFPDAADEWRAVLGSNKTDTSFDTTYTGPALAVNPGSDTGQISIEALVAGNVVHKWVITVYPKPGCSISGANEVCPNDLAEGYSSGPEDPDSPLLVNTVAEYSYSWEILAGGDATIIDDLNDMPTVQLNSGLVECGNMFTLQLVVRKDFYLVDEIDPDNRDLWAHLFTCESTCAKIVTVEDNIDPELAKAPDDISYQCSGDVPDAGPLGWTDNCDGSGSAPGNDVSDGKSCPETIVRTWTYTDACGNKATESQTITVHDTKNPVFEKAPDDISYECVGDVPAVGSLGWTDNCDGAGSAPGKDVSDGKTCPETITRTWTYKDACGNTGTASQTITVHDTKNPVLVGCPESPVIIKCLDELPDPATVTATDNCSSKPLVVDYKQERVSGTGDGCGDEYLRTWTATDDCGNSDSCSQRITLVDDTPPSITGFGFEHEAVCVIEGDLSDIKDGDTISVVAICKCVTDDFEWSDPEVADDCGGLSVKTTEEDPVIITKEYGEERLYRRTVEVEDSCRNKITVTVKVYLPACPMTYLTLTQGGWSAPKRKKSGKGNNDKTNGTLRDQIVEELLTKYGPLWIGKDDGNFVKVETTERKYLRVLLPGGGPAAPLPSGTEVEGISADMDKLIPLLNRNGRFANVLIGQYVSLQLNVWLNDCPEAAGEPLLDLDGLGDHVLTPKWCSIPAGAFRKCDILSPEEINAYFHSLNIMMGAVDQDILDALDSEGLPKTVNGLLELTRRYLAGHAAGGVKGSGLVSALASFNEGFHGGRIWIDPILCECLQAGDE